MTIFMKLGSLDSLEGAATLKEVDGLKGLMLVDGVDWGGARPISMEVGSASHGEIGHMSLGNVSVSRTGDGGTPYVQTMFFQPGEGPKTVTFILTKAERKGDGLVASIIVELEEPRMVS